MLPQIDPPIAINLSPERVEYHFAVEEMVLMCPLLLNEVPLLHTLAGFQLPHSFISLLHVEKWYKRACNNLGWVPWSLFSDWVLLHLLTTHLLIFKYI